MTAEALVGGSLPRAAASLVLCVRCERPLVGRSAYVTAGERLCLRCALRERALLRRSAATALVVGTVLVAINQGTVLVAGQFPPELLWKIPLTYVVPFCVATWGALGAARRSAGGATLRMVEPWSK